MKMHGFEATFLVCLSVILNLNLIKADQPVHCLKEQIVGEWIFTALEQTQDVDIFYQDTVCSHKLPNRIQIVKPNTQFSFPEDVETVEYKVTLASLESVSIQNMKSGEIIKGTWSMMYDQGFIIDTPSQRFIANFKYTPLSPYESQVDKLQVSSYDKFDSVCNETMIGTIFFKNHQVSCFYGQKTSNFEHQSKEDRLSDQDKQVVYFSSAQLDNKLAQTRSQEYKQSLASIMSTSNAEVTDLSKILYEDMGQLVNLVNTNSFTWKADINPRFEGKTLAELKEKNERPEAPLLAEKQVGPKNLAQTKSIITDAHMNAEVSSSTESESFLKAQAEASKYWYVSVSDFKDEELPESWDWRDVEGVDFTGRIRDQGNCGSCYTVSVIQSLEARTKIFTGKSVELSPQMIMDCNFMNEGCSGGWPILVGEFAKHFPIPTESCAPYKGITPGDQCKYHSFCDEAVRVEEAYYIGHFYGNSSELAMMKELRSRGPIIADLEVPLTFAYYTSGVFSEDHHKILSRISTAESEQILDEENINDKTIWQYSIEWQLLNHSIMIIGWGVENGVKYWLCRNSYGPYWGDAGHFKIRRGADDYGIESEPSAFIPELLI